MFEYRTSNRAQRIVDNIQQIIDMNLGKIENMMEEMNVNTIKDEVRSIRQDVDDMKETQLVLRDEVHAMKKEFGCLLSGLQTNFQSLLTDKYNPRTQFSRRQLDSGPYRPPAEGSSGRGASAGAGASNTLNFTQRAESRPARSDLPAVPIQVRKAPRHALFMDGDEDDFELPLYSEMMEKHY